MKEINIREMLEVMKPALRDEKLASALLGEYWRDKVSVVWTVKDILLAAWSESFACDPDLAKEILFEMAENHDAGVGLNWEVVKHYLFMRCVNLSHVPAGFIAVWDITEIG